MHILRLFSGAACEPQGGKGSSAAAGIVRWDKLADLTPANRALASFALRGKQRGPTQCEEREEYGEAGLWPGKRMERQELEDLRDRVPCEAVLESAGFALDLRESTRRAVKYRRGSAIIIVIHEGRGWFDPLSEAKGDVFRLVEHLDGLCFNHAVARVAGLIGFVIARPNVALASYPRVEQSNGPGASVLMRWAEHRQMWQGSAAWHYLSSERSLPDSIICAAMRADLLREGPYGSVWAAHFNDEGAVTGWEERGPLWRGFATGGSKVLFRFGADDALRLCVTEAAIDAMSLAAFEGFREGSLYLSTGGGWSPTTDIAIRRLAARPGARLIAATDANSQGETFASRLRDIADVAGCDWLRLKPPEEDWNDALRAREIERRERKTKRVGKESGGGLPHARRARQG